jgi:spermidine synthase
VPMELTTAEFFADVARVLTPTGVLLVNLADGPPLRYGARVVETVRSALPHVLVVADPGVVKRRRFGNIVVAASAAPLPEDGIRRAAARAAFPRGVVTSLGDGRVLTDDDPMRSPEPPEDTWRVQ